ncbi:hypothetical protein BJF79_32340 [Actinomadura sp. CNU-125]|uniref:outer membrane protein assembly factor BamB family protein n=1 Tax=Actinomadura sp. CNU-125 TaxID=1904961 RepID=UPI0009610EE7|nr:PQQ-binding-like beta-propeller repeat protein [Actinomadura sp. CNU-125]OLT35449.1 hypothetical protein BJF79_32340 [Actinomadura sp. CNU-125]
MARGRRADGAAVAAADGPLLWTADADFASTDLFGPVAAGRLFLVERPLVPRSRGRSPAVSCLDTATGRRSWSAPLDIPSPFELRKVAVSGSVAMVRTQGALRAFDVRTGRQLWRRNRNTTGSRSTTVTIGDGLAYDSGEDENAADSVTPYTVHAYEPGGGRLRWTASVRPRAATATAPIHAAGLLLAAATANRGGADTAFVYALDAVTGRQRWARPVAQGYAWPPLVTLSYAENTVFVSLNGRALYALDSATGTVRWRSAFELRADGGRGDRGGDGPTGADVPVAAGDTVYLCGADGVLRAFDARDGRERWAHPLGEEPSAVRAVPARPRPIVGNGLVYVTSRGTPANDFASDVHVLGADDGRLRWRRPSGGTLMAGGALHVSDRTAVTAYDPVGGAVLRRLDLRALGVDGTTELVADDARLYVLCPPLVLALSLRDR